MVEKTNANANQLFLLFNMILLLTFPFKNNQTLLTHLTSTSNPLILSYLPLLSYVLLFGLTYLKTKTEFTSTIRILSLLFALYHLIHLLF